MATWPGGSCWSFCCCAAVLGVITLKPAATSMLSLFWVLLVVAQPTVKANRVMTAIVLNEVCICFILFFRSSLFLVDDFDLSILSVTSSRADQPIRPSAYALQCPERAHCAARKRFGE